MVIVMGTHNIRFYGEFKQDILLSQIFTISVLISYSIHFRSFAEQNLRHSTVLVLAVPENGDPCYNMNEHSQGFKEGEELARSLSGTFMKMTNNYHMKSRCHIAII